MDLRSAALGSVVASALAGIALARRRAEHRPAAVALSALALANVAQVLTSDAVRRAGPVPVAVYIDGAAALATAVPPLALCAWVFLSPRMRRPAVAVVVVAWALASVALALAWPRGAALQRWYLTADVAGLALSVLALVTWAGWARGRASPGSSHAVAIGLVVLDIAILVTPFSPWRGSLFAGRYDVVQTLILVFFAVTTAAEVIVWRFSVR